MNQRSSKIGWLISSDFSFFNFFSRLPVTNSRKGSTYIPMPKTLFSFRSKVKAKSHTIYI